MRVFYIPFVVVLAACASRVDNPKKPSSTTPKASLVRLPTVDLGEGAADSKSFQVPSDDQLANAFSRGPKRIRALISAINSFADATNEQKLRVGQIFELKAHGGNALGKVVRSVDQDYRYSASVCVGRTPAYTAKWTVEPRRVYVERDLGALRLPADEKLRISSANLIIRGKYTGGEEPRFEGFSIGENDCNWCGERPHLVDSNRAVRTAEGNLEYAIARALLKRPYKGQDVEPNVYFTSRIFADGRRKVVGHLGTIGPPICSDSFDPTAENPEWCGGIVFDSEGEFKELKSRKGAARMWQSLKEVGVRSPDTIKFFGLKPSACDFVGADPQEDTP